MENSIVRDRTPATELGQAKAPIIREILTEFQRQYRPQHRGVTYRVIPKDFQHRPRRTDRPP